MIIYKITNKINGKVYVGQTARSLNIRWAQHISASNNGSKLHLHCAIRKYGVDNFIVEVIDTATSKEELDCKEKYWISYFGSTDNNIGYNCSYGGESNPMDFQPTKDFHDKRMRDFSVRSKISKSMLDYRKNNPFTVDTREKISKKMIGNKNGAGKIRPKEAVEATSTAHMKTVYCVDTNNNIVAEFNSVKEAAQWVAGMRNFKSVRSGNRIIKRSYDNNEYIDGLRWIYK